MTKEDLSILSKELHAGISYPGVDMSPLSGCHSETFPMNKIISKDALVMFLRWKCSMSYGTIDEEELSIYFRIFKDKKIKMV
jgi:hypothetical protein